jgi:L,D-peptidoglycan transpeptidase YkuD (ErfK/YbiS/YcfS/YnhG family)
MLGVLLALGACNGTPIESTHDTGPASVPSTPTTPTPPVTPTIDLALSASTYSASQGAGSVTVTVLRSGTGTAAASVNFATTDGTAVSGADYTSASGTLQWAENDATDKSVSVSINPAAFSGQKTFTIALSDPSSGAQVDSPSSATVTISGTASASVGTLELADASYTVSQAAKSVTVTVNRTDGAVGATSVAYGTSNGSATAGQDYTSTSGTLQWADGDSAAKTFKVNVSNATPFMGQRVFNVALSNPTAGAMVGTPAAAPVTINGDASPPVGSFQLGNSGYSIAQNGGSLQVTVQRVGGSNGAATVAYATSSGTAVSGQDFTAASGTLSWADGDQSTKAFSVAISNANPFSGNKTFTVALSNPSAGASVGNPGSATVVIAGDAAPPIGSLQLSAGSYSIGQAGGGLTVTVTRAGGSNGAVGVSYSTASGSAVAGTDFTATSGTLSWADGDTSSKSFAVPISNATPFTGTRSFTVKLTNASGGAALGSPSSATASITGDAVVVTPGSLQLSSSGYSVGQAAGTVKVTVNRTGGSGGAVSVGYATANGSASSGSDYTATSGTLNWANGDSASKSFTVPISNATPFSGTKSFSVTLSGPTGNATLSSPSSATVTITGSGVTNPPPPNAFWIYYNGVFNWGGDYSYVATINYNDTAGGPLSGPHDIAVTLTGAYGAWQPYAGGTVPLWNFNDSGYTYLTFAFKPTVNNQQAQIYFMKVGDIPVGIDIDPFNGQYGPAPKAGVWATYKIPLKDLGVFNTSVYKFAIQDQTGLGHNTFYLDNVGFE